MSNIYNIYFPLSNVRHEKRMQGPVVVLGGADNFLDLQEIIHALI